MEFFWMLVIGLVVGAVAKFILPGKDQGGCLVTILLGVAGAFVAGFLGRSLGWYQADDPAGFLASVVGAILLLFVFRLVSRK